MIRDGLWCMALAVAAHGQSSPAGNDIADAGKALFAAFPEASSYRRIVRDVDDRARTEVERRLPFKVHFNEFGAHALYVAFRGRKPVGVMYLRSEAGRWGLADIGWAVTTDLRIVSFWFVGGRDRHQRRLLASPFARRLRGRYPDAVAKLHAELEAGRGAGVPEGAGGLARTVLRSAMKATAVIRSVWRDDLDKLHDLAMGFDAFPLAERFRRRVWHARPDDTERAVRSLHVMRARGKANAELGSVVRATVALRDRRRTLRLTLTPDLLVTALQGRRGVAAAELRELRRELEGRRLREAAASRTPVGALASELAALLEHAARQESDR